MNSRLKKLMCKYLDKICYGIIANGANVIIVILTFGKKKPRWICDCEMTNHQKSKQFLLSVVICKERDCI